MQNACWGNTTIPEWVRPAREAVMAAPGKVAITSYAAKRIELKAAATVPSVLLLAEKHDPGWSVFVDGKPAPLLRCNYLMRGVMIPAGDHAVLFRFAPPFRIFYLSLSSILIALGLLAFVVFTRPRNATNS